LLIPGPELGALEAGARLQALPGRVVLSSGSDADGVGRWSFVAAEPVGLAASLAGLDALLDRAVGEAGEDPVAGPRPLLIGCAAYDLGRSLEPSAQARRPPADELGAPDLAFGHYPAIWRRDEHTGRCEVVGPPAAARRLHAALCRPLTTARAPAVGALLGVEPEAQHLAAVAQVLELLHAGDAYQVNIARWLRASCGPGDGVALLARVQGAAPAPYGAVLPLADGLELISASPERFLRRTAGSPRVETRPIKGTIPRGHDAADDAARLARLTADPKELAEHLMIVDLLRNDLGRLAAVGSVAVEGFARVLTLPTVHHLVSTVSARWPAVPPSRLLRATFPGGSITGAPKLRAMQIIDQLEPRRRGPYTGCIGWFGAAGACDLAITIRSLVRTRDALWLAVGGGIVADSSPAAELAETHAKAAAWHRALG
jgi:para-aminobenzoate synthetase component 1